MAKDIIFEDKPPAKAKVAQDFEGSGCAYLGGFVGGEDIESQIGKEIMGFEKTLGEYVYGVLESAVEIEDTWYYKIRPTNSNFYVRSMKPFWTDSVV